VTRHEDDRDANIRLGQAGLKIEAIDPRQPDVEDQAAGNIRKVGLQKFGGRAKHFDSQVHRSKQMRECDAHGGIVVNDENGRLQS
jgi:hypothetical protein